MKRFLLIALFCLFGFSGFSDTYYFAWDGVGFATHNNYNLAYGYGSYQYKGIANGLATGLMEIDQQFNMYYDKERAAAAGGGVRCNLEYYFLCPMVVTQLSKSGNVQAYADFGIGYLESGTLTLHKWSNVAWSSKGAAYDSLIDESGSINTMAFRLGFGFTEFYKLGGDFHLFIGQDVGFLVNPLANVNYDPNYSDLRTNMTQFFQPTYISLRIGIAIITHSKNNPTPYKIYY